MGLAECTATDLARRTRTIVVAATLVASRKALAARRTASAAGASRRAASAVSVIIARHVKSRFEDARLITEF
jgi:hypothetical protein